ncbi:hypothetical protein GCM10022214_33190 [Actinomadura miaoliensis]|uniref:Uncharacterized protein n=1 Tax=Actinomadura miaoliensis TaxID=430685 RepID=A0ABP7VTW1_9ACTN
MRSAGREAPPDGRADEEGPDTRTSASHPVATVASSAHASPAADRRTPRRRRHAIPPPLSSFDLLCTYLPVFDGPRLRVGALRRDGCGTMCACFI